MATDPKPLATVPAGDARRDQAKINADALAAAAETQGAEVGAVDPAKLDLDREIAFEIVERNALEVSGAQPGYRYCWVRAYDRNGKADMAPIYEKQAIRVRLRGASASVPAWEVVVGKNGPEALENLSVEGYRRIGDCILLRCKREVYDALSRDEQRRADEFAGKYTANIDDAIRQSGMQGIITATPTGGLSSRQYAQMRREFARNGDLKVFEKMAREGRIPNLTPAQAAGR